MPLIKILEPGLSQSPQQVYPYIFSVTWAIEGICSIYLLQGKTDSGIWQQIITNAVTDSDGEISIKIGDFNVGRNLTIGFGILAITDLKKLAVFVTNSQTGVTRKMQPPRDDIKDLAKTETWDGSFSFQTF